MQLGKLLFAGKSVVNGCQKLSYRQNKLVALPKFVSAKNPFVPPKASPDTDAAPVKPASAPAAVATQKRPLNAGAAKSLSAWTARLNPVSLWNGSAPATPKVLPTVQTELSLDAVKVVHNDLSDADVEVVPIKSRPAVSLVPAAPAKKTWEILGERLLKATAL